MTLQTYLTSVTPIEHALRVAELVVDPYPDIATTLGHLYMATIKSNRDFPHCESPLLTHSKFLDIQEQGKSGGMTDSDRSLLYSLFSREEVAKVVTEAQEKQKAKRKTVSFAGKKTK